MVILLLAIAALLFAPEVAAQHQVAEEDFLASVLDRDDVLAVLAEPVSSARASLSRAGLYSNPEIGFEREAPRGGVEQDTWSISWVLPLDGRILPQRSAAKAGLRAAELDRVTARLTLRGELRAVYAEWALADERARLATGLSTLVARLATAMRSRASQGEASLLAARRLAMAHAEIQAGEALAVAHLEAARARIRGWSGELPLDVSPVRPSLPLAPADSDLTDQSAEVLARREELEQAGIMTGLTSRFWALPELSFGWQTLRQESNDIEGPVFGVRWPLPLFDRRQAERVEAKGREAAVRGRLRLAEARVRASLDATRATYARLRESAEALLETEGAGARVVESAAALFEAGESGVTDLLESLRGVWSARMVALDLYGSALEAHRDLERAAGKALAPKGGAGE
jgi:outer membrane protein TolC